MCTKAVAYRATKSRHVNASYDARSTAEANELVHQRREVMSDILRGLVVGDHVSVQEVVDALQLNNTAHQADLFSGNAVV